MKALLVLCFLSLSSYAGELPGDSVYQLKARWTDQDGNAFRLSALTGKPVVAAMAYTSCRSSCPWIVEGMKKIDADAARAGNKVTFLLVSFDSRRDTPAALKKFAAGHGLDPARWKLLHGDAGAVRELAAVLGVRYKSGPGGGFDHSNLLTLLDANGVIRLQKSGLPPKTEEIEKKLSELRE